MLKWCSYCQQFMGEVPDYDDLLITHGTCRECHPATFRSAKLDLTHARFLKGVQRKLWNAGRASDLKVAESTIDDAVTAGLRPIDVLMGMIAPMLYQVGEDWKRGVLDVEGEHQFTSFCERVLDLIGTKSKLGLSADGKSGGEILLMNAFGNRHTLAVRVLALWLKSKGRRTEIVDAQRDTDPLLSHIRTKQPKLLLISMALSEQYGGVNELAERIAELPEPVRPRVVVGGYAVKLGLVPPIQGADMMADISLLQ